jgi:hypothetical protein
LRCVIYDDSTASAGARQTEGSRIKSGYDERGPGFARKYT